MSGLEPDPLRFRWFVPKLDKVRVESVVASSNDGDFLVRRDGSDYTVCVNDMGRCSNYKIRVLGPNFVFANKPFPSIQEIVKVMSSNPIQRANGQPLLLRGPAGPTSRSPNLGRRGIPTSDQRVALAAHQGRSSVNQNDRLRNQMSPPGARMGSTSLPSMETKQALLRQQAHAGGDGPTTRRQVTSPVRAPNSHSYPHSAARPGNTGKSKGTQVKVRKQPGLGFGLTLNDISPFGVMVSGVKAEKLQGVIVPGMQIKSVNGKDCETKNVEFIKACLANVDEADMVFMPDPRAADISTADGELALYIAPIDISGFDKLDVKAIEKNSVDPMFQGKLFNRYIDILPGPATRVPLSIVNNNPTSTYINANFVRGYYGEQKYYIAAQGPLPHTTISFVRMLWEQRCQIIVQVTNFKEKGKRKCERYFPVQAGDRGAMFYDDIRVVLLQTKRKEGFQVSKLEITKSGFKPLLLNHYWFISWPDHGVPQTPTGQLYPDEVLAMMKEIRKNRDQLAIEAGLGKDAAPMVVHCSAGVGRTGTIIAIDHVMNAIKKANKVDLNQIIDTIRDDRMALVQHTIQYKFAFQAIINYAEEAVKALKGDIYEMPAMNALESAAISKEGVYTSVQKGGKTLRKLSRGSFTLKVEKSDKAVYTPGFGGLQESPEEEEEVEKVDNIEDEPWYYGPLPRAQMRATLEQAPVGAFGVRSSESQPGCYVLTLQQKSTVDKDGKKMLSILIKPHDVDGGAPKFRLDQCSDKLFDSVPALVRYFREHNVMYVDDRTGEQHLLYLLPNTD